MRDIRAIALALVVALVAGSVGSVADDRATQAQGSPLAPPTDDQLNAAAALEVSDTPPTGSLEVDLYAAEQDALAVGRSMPAADWQIPALAQALGYDPMAAFAFVRDRIGFDAYGGTLRGPRGTLAARSGNALDRALLLRAILDEMLVPSRLAFGTLGDATAAAVVARSFNRPSQPLSAPPATDAAGLEAIATRARRDDARIRTALGTRIGTMDGDGTHEALRDVRDHAWVQMEYGPGWMDLDPTLPDAQPGATLTTATSTAEDLPPGLGHDVRLEVIAETFDGTALSDQVVLDQTLDAAAATREDIFLTFHPELPALANGMAQALNGTSSWTPALNVGSEVIDGEPFPILPGADLFGDPEGGRELTALRLVITTHSPDGIEQQHTRVLYDRVPPAIRAAGSVTAADLPPIMTRDGVPDPVGAIHQVIISTGAISARGHAFDEAFAARWTGALITDPAGAAEFSLADQLRPMAVGNEQIALASERLIRESLDTDPSVRAYPARPRVFIASILPSPGEPGVLLVTDLAIDTVRVLTSGQDAADAAARQVWYGALESSLETQVGLGRAAFGDPREQRMGGLSLLMADPLTVVDAGDAGALPAGADPYLRADVAQGMTAVIPGDPATARGWWAIRASDGATRAVLSPGLGEWWNYQNYTPNTGPRLNLPDPEVVGNDYYDYNRIIQAQNELEARAAAARAAPQQVCFGANEETQLLCISTTVARAIAIGLGVTIALAILYVTIRTFSQL